MEVLPEAENSEAIMSILRRLNKELGAAIVISTTELDSTPPFPRGGYRASQKVQGTLQRHKGGIRQVRSIPPYHEAGH